MVEQISTALLTVIIIFIIWELAWKGYGMWRASRNNQPIWFICILLINTIGVLPIVYIFFFQEDKNKKIKIKK